MNHRAGGNQNSRSSRSSRSRESSDLTDMKALAAAATARPPTVPPLRPRAPELSGMVGRRDSVVGARVTDRASLLAGLSWLWVAAGVAAVLVPGMTGVLILSRASAAPASHAVAARPAPATTTQTAAAERAAAQVEVHPLVRMPAMMPEPEVAAAEPAKPTGRYYYHRRRHGSRAASAAAMAAMTGGGGPGAPAGAGAAAPAGGAAPGVAGGGDDATGDKDEAEGGDEPEKAPPVEKPKKVVAAAEAAPDEPTNAAPRTVKELRSALARLQGRVVQCHQRFQIDGVADVRVAVNPSGTVESASLAGDFEGTPTGDCIVRAVSAASFPTFDGTESVRVSHSFALQ
jgi:hypothetical protein